MNSINSNRAIGLHQITAMEAEPAELVEIAHAAGYQEVCVFTHIPNFGGADEEQESQFPVVTDSNKMDVLAALQHTGVKIANVEFFSIYEGLELESFRKGLQLGKELGARCAVTHVLDANEARATELLIQLADMAAEYDLKVGLEFMGVSPPCNSIDKAVEFAKAVNRPNLGIAVDMLHLTRTGSSTETLRTIPPQLIQYAQVCDGRTSEVSADYMDEALNHRMLPGTGCFAIADILKALPEEVALDVEVPNVERQNAGITALAFAKECRQATLALLNDTDH